MPEDVCMKGCVSTVAEGLESAARIGFPVMIKVRAGPMSPVAYHVY